MKTSFLLCLMLAASHSRGLAAPLNSAIAYQGRLTDAGASANGEYDLHFALYNADLGGSQSGATLTNQNVLVTNGVFTTALDFGTNIFTGQALWLEIAVRPAISEGAFAPLTPRQPLTAAPYAPYALYALTPAGPQGPVGPVGPQGSQGLVGNTGATGQAGAVRPQGLPGATGSAGPIGIIGPIGPISQKGDTGSAGLQGPFGPQGPPGSTDAWGRVGNADTIAANNFIGTTDNQSLELRVNNARALRLQPDTSPANAPNVIGGSPVNLVALGVVGTTIAGGGVNLANGDHTFVVGGNVSIGTASSTARLRVVSATCDGTTWNNASDRNLKDGFAPVDTRAVLAKVAALPLQSWHYTNAPGTQHIGPMAQDFQAAFGLGSDDKTIPTVDADGVSLAAIQGLNEIAKSQAAEIVLLKNELTELRALIGGLKEQRLISAQGNR